MNRSINAAMHAGSPLSEKQSMGLFYHGLFFSGAMSLFSPSLSTVEGQTTCPLCCLPADEPTTF